MKHDVEIRKFLTERGIEHVKIGVFDTDGILRGKYLRRDKFLSALDKHLGFCDVILGWDSNDPTLRQHEVHRLAHRLPRRHGAGAARHPARHSVRAENRAVSGGIRRARRIGLSARRRCGACSSGRRAMGYAVSAAAEFEFFLFEETPQSVREKGYRQLKTMTPGAFGYSVLRSSVHSDLYHELLDLGQTMRFPIEGLHTETGPGVLEAALTYCDALEAADRAALFKTFAKVLAQRHGLMATFMAKWSNSVPGQSGHLHISLRAAEGEQRIPRPVEAA